MNNVYIYDSYLSEKSHQKALAAMEIRLTDLGLNGKIYRLTPMTRLSEIIRDELKRKAKTIVAVGGDSLFSKLATLLSGTDTPLAILPIGEKSACAKTLGITEDDPCKVLAARRIVNLDTGKIDAGQFFLCEALIKTEDSLIRLNRDIEITVKGQAEIKVVNILPKDDIENTLSANPEDGKFNIFITVKDSGGFLKKSVSKSFFLCESLEIENGVKEVLIDSSIRLDKASRIDIVPKAIFVIVGKERSF